MFAVSSYCTSKWLIFLEWAEQLMEGFPNDEIRTLTATTKVSDAFATESELQSTRLSYKQHFYKQCQAEICEKSSII